MGDMAILDHEGSKIADNEERLWDHLGDKIYEFSFILNLRHFSFIFLLWLILKGGNDYWF